MTPLLTSETLAALRSRGVKAVSISLDGATPETHEGIRLVEGQFEATLAALRPLRSHGFTVQVNTLVMRENVHELADIARLVKEVGASIWELFFLVQVGRGTTLEELSSAENEDVCHFLFDASRYDFVVRTVEAPFFRRVVAWRNGDPSRVDPGARYGLGPLYETLAARLRTLLGEQSSEPKAQVKGTRGKGIVNRHSSSCSARQCPASASCSPGATPRCAPRCCRRAATARFVWPCASSRKTSRSRAERNSGVTIRTLSDRLCHAIRASSVSAAFATET